MPSGSVIVATVALLAALAAVALLLDGDAVQAASVAVVVLWALWMVASPGRPAGHVPWPMLLLRILPIVVAGAIAEALASDRWFPFTFAALAVALVIPWAAGLGAWQRRRATREDS